MHKKNLVYWVLQPERGGFSSQSQRTDHFDRFSSVTRMLPKHTIRQHFCACICYLMKVFVKLYENI